MPPLVSDPCRRRWLQAALGSAAAGLAGCAAPPKPTPPAPGGVMPFSASPGNGQHPQGWSELTLRPGKVPTRYAAVRDAGRTVLHAHAVKGASGLQTAVNVDPLSHPRLRFSWRITRAPGRAAVNMADDDDAPVRVLIGFDGDHARLSVRDRLLYQQAELFTGQRPPFATLAYVWCGQSPLRTIVANHRTGRLQYKVVETGGARVGRWLHYETNLVEDYRRAFGGDPGRVISVGVLTDSDATQGEFEAWYGDISIGA